MTDHGDVMWKRLKALYRRSQHLPPTDAELDAFSGDEQLSTSEIEGAVTAATSGESPCNEPAPEDCPWEAIDTRAVEEGVLQLNRNRGVQDEKTEKRLSELRTTKGDWKWNQLRQRKAEEAADEVHDAVGFVAQPVDPFAIVRAEAAFLKLCSEDFGDAFDGQLEYHPRDNQFMLFLNTKYDRFVEPGMHHPRTRFSLAHELAHYFLPEHRAYLMRNGQSHRSASEFAVDSIVEREADSFAAALLMPRKHFRPRINEAELSLARLETLASDFNTSLVSTAIRAVRLSDFPCAVIGMREGVIAWSFLSEALIDAGCYPPPTGSSGSPNAEEMWDRVESGESIREEAESRVSQWFRIYDREDLDEVWLTEGYATVPSMRTLLVLLCISEEDLPGDDA